MDNVQRRYKNTAQMDSDPSVPAAAGVFVRDPAASLTGNRILPGVDHRAPGERAISGVTQTRQIHMDNDQDNDDGLTNMMRFSQVSISRVGPKDSIPVPVEKEKERVVSTRAGRSAAKKTTTSGNKKKAPSSPVESIARSIGGSEKEEDDGIKTCIEIEEELISDPFTPRKSLSRSPPRGLCGSTPSIEHVTAIPTTDIKKKTGKMGGPSLFPEKEEEDISTDYESGRKNTDLAKKTDAIAEPQTDLLEGEDRSTKTVPRNKKSAFKQPKAPAKKRNPSPRTYHSDAGTTENDGTEGDNTEDSSHKNKSRNEKGRCDPEKTDKRIGTLLDTFTQLVTALLPEGDTGKVAMIKSLLSRVKDIITGAEEIPECEIPSMSMATLENRSEKRKYNFTSPPAIAMPEKKRNQGTDPPSGPTVEEPWNVVTSRTHRRTAKMVTHEVAPPPNSITQSRMENNKISKGTNEFSANPRKRSKKMINKGEAIVVPLTDKENYYKTMGEIREGLGNCQEGVRKVRLTRGGNILLELEKDPTNTSKIQEKLKEKMGPDVLIRKLTPTGILEFKNVDPTVTVEEADSRFREAVGILDGESDKTFSVKIRRGPMGTQIVNLVAPLAFAHRLMEMGRLRLGLTVVTPRLIPRVTQCMACCGFGHYARDCRENPNGPPICRGCGLPGHRMEGCTKPLNCTLCRKDGLTGENLMHIAGASRCPAYKKEMIKIRNGG